jgi:SSS family solute:Na+ symporter
MCLAVAGTTGWSIYGLIVVAGIATLVYTLFGGIEGVVWTDVTQGFLLLLGGLLSLGFVLFSAPVSPMEVIAVAWDADKFRLAVFRFSWDQVTVYVLLVFGLNLYLTRYGTDQTVVQRYLLAPSSGQAARALWISMAALCFVWILFMSIGVLLWAFYEIQPNLLPPDIRARPDQVLAYFIGHQLPPGVTGLILAGVFAASMSTLSSDLNSLASVLAEDFYGKLARSLSDQRQLLFSRLSVLVAGSSAIVLALFLTRIGSIVDAFFTMVSVVGSGILGAFCLGFLTRRGSSKGLYVSLIIGILFVAWATISPLLSVDAWSWLPRYRGHVYWVGMIGNLIVFIGGYLASLLLTPAYRARRDLTVL